MRRLHAPDAAGVICNPAAAYHERRRSPEAQRLYERALEIREKRFGPEHKELAFVLRSLGDNFKTLPRYNEAEQVDKRSFARAEGSTISFRPDTPATSHKIPEHRPGKGAAGQPSLRCGSFLLCLLRFCSSNHLCR
jgi:hypothetical protein